MMASGAFTSSTDNYSACIDNSCIDSRISLGTATTLWDNVIKNCTSMQICHRVPSFSREAKRLVALVAERRAAAKGARPAPSFGPLAKDADAEAIIGTDLLRRLPMGADVLRS
jgi:hypothetical protein